MNGRTFKIMLEDDQGNVNRIPNNNRKKKTHKSSSDIIFKGMSANGPMKQIAANQHK